MDKVRDVKRGASRFSKQSGHKLSSGLNGVFIGGDFGSLEKSKERVKRLSAVCKDSSSNEEMGCCDVSDREDEHHPYVTSVGSGKRFKLPKMFFDDCNGVNNSLVPRKLRSAMKKRNRESVSPPLPDSKKLNQAIGEAGSPKKDGTKKSKLNMKEGGTDWSHKQAGSGPITKDEEEVVETLYSLAGMFHDSDATDQDKLNGEKANPPAFPALLEAEEGPTSTKEDSVAVKEDLSCPSETAEPSDPSSSVQKFPEEAFEVDSSNQPVVQEQSNLLNCEKISVDLDIVVPELNSQAIPLLVNNGGEKPLCNAIDLCIPPKQNQDTNILKEASNEESSPLQQKPGTALGLAMALGVQMNQPQMRNKEPKNIALWPGLSSTLPTGAQGHGPPQWSSNIKVPAWLGTSISVTGQNSFENDFSSGKVSQVKNGKISWKRCAAHVYISHQIRALKMPDSGNRMQLLPNQLRQDEIPKQGVLVGVNKFSGVRSGLDGVSSAISSGNCSDKKLNEVHSDIYRHGRQHQDQPQASLAPKEYTSPKQGFDFLSLSAGSGGIETSNSLSRAVNGSEQSSQLQVPYLQSHAHHPMLMSLSVPQVHYTSAYPDQPAAATQQAQQQLYHPYLGRPFYGPNTSTTSLTKQQQQLQYQQRFWTAQLASQYRPAKTSTSLTPFPSWQNGRQDYPALIPRSQPAIPLPLSFEVLGPMYPKVSQQQQQQILCSQPAIAPSLSSLEVLGPKYPQISLQQQQHLMSISSSLRPAGEKSQDHHLYSVYEETGGSFRANGALPLQLLCNEHL
ncbi:uncharacterized protein LOC120010739 isoform X1 [Tripterygium wilfordii]|uniref:uncharacterized protein LOC120010739 isoform X1 n=2 Tax=Tripterygium wilfordii TaxID=458696 RepID=UPI0018F820CA|nr:uncharacterized protein LOC120010739 isoform X1 [Tripterygium wilfordii]